MKKGYLIAVGVVLVAVVGVGFAQLNTKQSPVPGNSTLPPTIVPTPSVETAPLAAPAPKRVEAKPEDMTIEQLIDAVEKLREQKDQIEKKEKAHMKVLQMKAEKLKQKIDTLNGVPQYPPPVNSQGAVLPGAPATTTGTSLFPDATLTPVPNS